MHTLQRGITLVGLLIAVAIIVLLVTVAVPVYRDYSVSTEVRELVRATDSARITLAQGMQRDGSWSPSWVSAIRIAPSGYVARAGIDAATGTIIVSGTAPTAGSIITMTPRMVGGRKLEWTCSGTPQRYMPSNCR